MPGWEEKTGQPLTPVIAVDGRRDKACLIVMTGSAVGQMYPLASETTIIGRGEKADLRLLDDGVSREHARIVIEGAEIVVEDLGSTNGTFCNGVKIARTPLRDGDKILIGATTVLKFTFHDMLDESFQRQMYESALRDGLTKAFNKKYLLDRLDSEFAYAVRHKAPLSLIMLDLDLFKQINDTFGHPTGDRVLVGLSNRITVALRSEDVFARFGGEEFAVVCRGIDESHARIVAERLRKVAALEPFIFDDKRVPITVSLGVACMPDVKAKEAGDLVAAADEALYEAKRLGRNRVCSKTS